MTAEALIFKTASPTDGMRSRLCLVLSLGLHVSLAWFVLQHPWVNPIVASHATLVFELEQPKPIAQAHHPKPVVSPVASTPAKAEPKAETLQPAAKTPSTSISQVAPPVAAKQTPAKRPTTPSSAPTASISSLATAPSPSVSLPQQSASGTSAISHADPELGKATESRTGAAPAATNSQHSTPASAGSTSSQNSTAISTWQGRLLGRLERYKRYPRVAQELHQQGTAHLRFAMNRRGKVLFSRIEKSSGIPVLDEETLALIHRAEPLPSPPPEIASDPIELVVPVQFFLK